MDDFYRFGIINKAGETITQLKYNYIYPFSNGLARVQFQYGKTKYIDITGKEVPDSDENGNWLTPYEYNLIRQNGKQGLIDTAGNEILPCEYQIIN